VVDDIEMAAGQSMVLEKRLVNRYAVDLAAMAYSFRMRFQSRNLVPQPTGGNQEMPAATPHFEQSASRTMPIHPLRSEAGRK
jgi:hypothetical protein